MKLLLKTGIVASFMFVSGCNMANTMDDNDTDFDQLDPQIDQSQGDKELNRKIGFVRYTKDEHERRLVNDNIATMDRMKMADIITNVILQTDGFEEVATLVTDQEVLIAYDRNEQVDEVIAADIAKKAAVSVMPGFFDVYVSDNQSLIKDIQSLHNSTTENRYYDNTIDTIINEMKRSPQGK